MRRRVVLAGLASATAAWPLITYAQQARLPVIGFLNGASPEGYAQNVAAFRDGLKESGFIEGQNVLIEYRWAEGRYDRLPALAGELVRLQVAVIAATSTPAALAAKAATTTIPIVFTTSSDPVQLNLVTRLSGQGGNSGRRMKFPLRRRPRLPARTAVIEGEPPSLEPTPEATRQRAPTSASWTSNGREDASLEARHPRMPLPVTGKGEVLQPRPTERRASSRPSRPLSASLP